MQRFAAAVFVPVFRTKSDSKQPLIAPQSAVTVHMAPGSAAWLSCGARYCCVALPDVSVAQLARMHVSPIPAVPDLDMAPPSSATTLQRACAAWRIVSTTDLGLSPACDQLLLAVLTRLTLACVTGQQPSVADRKQLAKLVPADKQLAQGSEFMRQVPELELLVDDKLRFPECIAEPLQAFLQNRGLSATVAHGRTTSKPDHEFTAQQVLTLCFELMRSFDSDAPMLAVADSAAIIFDASAMRLIRLGQRLPHSSCRSCLTSACRVAELCAAIAQERNTVPCEADAGPQRTGD